MKVLFIGGSNLVLTQGISAKLPQALMAAGLSIESCTNIAVGGTGSLFGLENLTTYAGQDHDLIFIEYGINDLPIFSRAPTLWEQGFIGLLKLIRARYPTALVVTLILGRRDERFWEKQSKLHLEMIRLSRLYGAEVIDFDTQFKGKAFQKEAFSSLYLDGSHYRLPLVTGYIAQECALTCIGLLQDRCQVIQKHICLSNSAADAHLTLHLTQIPGESREFSNTRFKRNTTVLERGKSLVIEVPGVPVGLSFVSFSDSCSVHLRIVRRTTIVHTLHSQVRSSRFPFIVKHVPLFGGYIPGSTAPESTRVELSAIDCQSPFWSEKLVQKTYGMEEPSGNSEAVYLCAISSFVS